MTDEIIALAGELLPDKKPDETVLRTLCKASEQEVSFQLRSDISPEECRDSFVMAAALVAASHYAEAVRPVGGSVKSFSVGEVSVTAAESGSALRKQAELLMKPFSRSGFSFRGVS